MKYYAAILLILAVPLHAQINVPPELVEREHAFRDAAREKGTREAFLEFLAPKSILFRPGPVDGISWMKNRPPSPGILSWEPEFGDLAASGELGFTTGPWDYRLTPTDTPESHGTYVTIWKRGAEGRWKAVLDAGVSHPEGEREQLYLVTGPVTRLQEDSYSELTQEEQLEELEPLDEEISEKSRKSGLLKTFSPILHPAVRFLRAETAPIIGAGAVKSSLKNLRLICECETEGAGLAASEDFGYTYGLYTLSESAQSDEIIEMGSYLRIWKRDEKDRWKLLLDLHNPFPRKKTEN